MKSLPFALVLCLSVVTTAATALAAPPAVGTPGVLRVATEGQYPPFNYFDNDRLTGFEVELAEAVAKELDLKLEWKTFPFDSLLIGLTEGRYDLVAASHSVTPERARAVDFTSPEYCTGGVIVAREGGPKTSSDLKGKIVAVQVGTTYATQLQSAADIKELKTYPRDTDCLQNLMTRRADAWITEKFVALDLAKKQPSLKLQLGDTLIEEKVAMAVAKGNTALLSRVNQAFFRIERDGTYARLSAKYFGQDIGCK
jgi:polar amino acid transport system substrate-binding protein